MQDIDESKRLDFVAQAVNKFKGGDRLREAKVCRAYYDTDNPRIRGRRKLYAAAREVQEGGVSTVKATAKENRFAANEKVASSFFRDITDNKVQYIAGEGADVNAAAEADAEAVKGITAVLGDQIKRVGQECLTDALVYRFGYAYMQVINGAIKLQAVPYCEVIPFYDRYGVLERVIRYYKRNGCEFADLHTKDAIYSYERNENDKGGAEWRFAGESPQIITNLVYGDGSSEAVEGKGWARLPWFEMQHNNDRTTSLTTAARTMIDCYDVTVSDFANNLIDMQDVFINLKDTYGSGADWGEQLEMLRMFKASESIDSVTTIEVPYQAREVLLSNLRSGIYSALRGVDVRGIATGGVTLATSIRALYADVDLWADQAEWHLCDWVREVLALAASYMGVTLPPVNITFQRRMILDEAAQMAAIAAQQGVISNKTLLENHPLVTDAQVELERINAELADAAYSAGL